MKLKSRKAASLNEPPALSELASAYSLTRPMRKIRCPNCAVVNLEKFITYPHCAGCGALLSEIGPSKRPWAAWRRPVGPILWATVVGGAVATVVASLMLLDARRVSQGKIALYGQVQRRIEVGSTFSLSLSLDTIDSKSNAAFKDVTLRLDQKFLHDFQITDSQPSLGNPTTQGRGRYFVLGQLSRDGQVSVRFKALRPGKHTLRATMYVKGQEPGDYQATITVRPKSADTFSASPQKEKP